MTDIGLDDVNVNLSPTGLKAQDSIRLEDPSADSDVPVYNTWLRRLFCLPPLKYQELRFDYSNSPDKEFCADKIIKLSEGYTSYKLIEPKKVDGRKPPLIVLLHGIKNCSYMWADIAELLAHFEQGPRAKVLILDFYGFGRSPWDGRHMSLDYLVTQVRELMDVLGLADQAASLIGYDLGGAVATGFAARYPHFCKSLTLIGTLGVIYRTALDEGKLLKKFYGELEMSKQRRVLALPQRHEADFYDLSKDSVHRKLIDKQIAMVDWQIQNTPGYLGALLSLIRSFPIRDLDELFAAVGRHSRKCLIMWGVQDKICPYKQCTEILENLFPNAVMVDVLQSGHNCVLEQFEEVTNELISFHREVFE